MIDCTNETERLRRVAELALVEAPVDPLTERLCALACGLLSMPMAFVTVLDATLAHVKAHHGLGYVSVPRRDAFCDVAIRGDHPLIIPDLAADPRFCDNPLVVGDPGFRFYAGIPLALEPGVRLGVLCVGDHVPRQLCPEQIECLQTLAGLALGQIRHHATRRTLARQAIELTRKQKILTQTAQLAGVGGFELDPETGAFTPSDELRRLLACDDVPTLERFVALFAAEPRAELHEGLSRLGRGGETLDIEAVLACGNAVARVHAETLTTAAGLRIVGILQDVTARKAEIGELEWLATHDALTRVCNRATFTERIEAAIRRADIDGRRVALVILDVDRFKTINDTLGHDAGDAVLVALAQRLVAAVGRRGTVARLGGDEFGVLIGDLETEGVVAAVAADILARLRLPLAHEGHQLSTHATLGIALSDPDLSCATSLFKEADIALYEAKKAGRDGFAMFRASMREELEGRLARLATARLAIAERQIEPWYQPQVDLATGAVVGFEALLRCHDAHGDVRGPDALGEAFADPELAAAIGGQMRDRVAADIAGWIERGVAFGRVALNVAEAEFQGDDFAERLIAFLAAHGLPAHAIEVEVTEAVLLGHRGSKAATALAALSAAGIAIALDDFGTGYASLTHLRAHPVDRIKIDRSLVRDIETSTQTAYIVDAVVALAHSLGLGVVAEGIETEAQLDHLRSRACAFGQGYLFARPMPGSRVPYFLRTFERAIPAPLIAACG